MLKNHRWMWTHWEQPAVSCGKQRVGRRNSFLEACSFFFPPFFFFCSATSAEVTSLQQQQPRTGEHQWREGTEERKVPPRHCLNPVFVSVDAAGNAAATVGASAGGGERNLTSHTHGQTYAWIPTLFPFANAKGNMQRSFTIICTSLLGICLGSSLSFPSNINIGENGAHTAQRVCFSPLHSHNLSCVILSALSSINSRLFADQQGGCSQPSRTNMRFFVSPSLTTRTSPNWCRRWIWLKWETASPWHMLVSIAGIFRNLSILCFLLPSCSNLSVPQLHEQRLTPKPSKGKIAYFVRCTDAWVALRTELLRGTTEVSAPPSVITAWFCAQALQQPPSRRAIWAF